MSKSQHQRPSQTPRPVHPRPKKKRTPTLFSAKQSGANVKKKTHVIDRRGQGPATHHRLRLKQTRPKMSTTLGNSSGWAKSKPSLVMTHHQHLPLAAVISSPVTVTLSMTISTIATLRTMIRSAQTTRNTLSVATALSD